MFNLYIISVANLEKIFHLNNSLSLFFDENSNFFILFFLIIFDDFYAKYCQILSQIYPNFQPKLIEIFLNFEIILQLLNKKYAELFGSKVRQKMEKIESKFTYLFDSSWV